MLNKSVMVAVCAALSLTACATHGQGVPMGQMQPQYAQQQRCSAPEFSLAESRNSSQSWTGELLDVRDIVIVKPHSNTGAQVVGGVTGGALANSCEPFARGMPVIITQLPGGYHVTPM